jgi:hypothetical protein
MEKLKTFPPTFLQDFLDCQDLDNLKRDLKMAAHRHV